MPGPSSPTSRAKAQQRKEKKARPDYQNPQIAKVYTPDNNSIVHQLPRELSRTGREWWDKYAGTGGEFELSKGSKGGHEGATAWVRMKAVNEWWAFNFPDAPEASEMDRAWFLQTSGLGRLIWAHLDNYKRKEEKQEGNATPKKTPKAPKTPLVTSFKKKAIAHDAYRRAHPEPYDKAIKDWEELNGRPPPLHIQRQISSNLFKKLSKYEQEEWRREAVAALQRSRELAKITDPKERAEFLQNFWKTLRELLKEGSEFAGIEVCALVVHDTEDGETRVTRELSKGIQGFSNSARLAGSMNALKEYLEAMGEHTIDNFPIPVVYPDYTKGGYPCLPNFQGWSLRRLQKLLRDFIKAVFRFQGGVGRMIWTEMKAAMDYWIDPQRCPKVKNLVFDDPSHLDIDMVHIWLAFLLACLTRKVPPEERFQFLRVPAGTTPIHPSESQETRREQVERDGKLVYILVFEDIVDKCHRVGGMSYKQPAIDFANAIAMGGEHADAASAPPLRWLSLPTLGPNTPPLAFFGTELERLLSLALLLPEASKSRILNLIEVINNYQSHIPATHLLGVWLRKGGIPLVLAQSPQELSTLSLSFWLPRWYFQPGGPAEGSLYFFEIFQEEMRGTEVILHLPSKTFYGGHTGIVCIVRALIQIYLNCLALRGDFKAPEDVPAGYDVSRFNVMEHDRIVGWIDNWIKAIKEHTGVLRETSGERKQGLAAVQVAHSDTSEDSEQETSPTIAPLSPAPVPSIPNPPTQPKAATKGKGPERVHRSVDGDSNYDSNHSRSLEVDYDALDKRSVEEESTDGEGLDAFNRKFLDDDIFPPGDLLGLRERYELNPEVTLHIHNGCQPYQEVLPEDLWDQEKTEPLFGGFPDLLQFKAPRLSRPDSTMRQLIALEVEAKRAKESWDLYGESNPRFPSNLRRWTKDATLIFPDASRPLFRLLFTRLIAWLRAKAMAPYVFAHWKTMAYILRESEHLYATSDCLIDKGDFPDPTITAQDLAAQATKSKLRVVELSYVCTELKDWYELSMEYMDKLRGNWLVRKVPLTIGEVIDIVDGVVEWTDATIELGEKHVERKRKIWEDMLDIPFVPPQSAIVYLFGCPTGGELPTGLFEALELARTTNPSDMVNQEVHMSLMALGVVPSAPTTTTNNPDATSSTSPTCTSSPASSPIVDPVGESSNISARGSTSKVTQSANAEPPEDVPEGATAAPRPSNLPVPQVLRTSTSAPSSEARSNPSPEKTTPHPPASPASAPSEARKSRKRKTTLGSEQRHEPETSQRKRTSARLQEKLDPQASVASKGAQITRRVLPPRAGRK